MAYGASAFGASALGGTANAVNEQVFFPLTQHAQGVHESTVSFDGDGLYQILAYMGTAEQVVNFEAFTSNDPGETPQSQGRFGGVALFHEYIVPAARFITVRASVEEVLGNQFRVAGRPYSQ